MLQRLERAVKQRVEAVPEVLVRVMDYVSPERYYPRREIALARFALALAQLEGKPVLLPEHVEDAARLLGVTAQANEEGENPEDQQAASRPIEEEESRPVRSNMPPVPLPAPARSLPQTQTTTVPETTYSENLEAATLCSEDPYPEDSAPIEREAASLQLALSRSVPSRSVHGPIIGVEASDTLDDLALTSTILTALKFQPTRGFLQKALHREIVFASTDLRRYRRGSALEHVLMILLDYTSLRANPNWQEILLPYLNKAYTERAGIVIIQVGAKNAISELQAEIVSARNITVPEIGKAFEALSGLASPLAHGFILAQERLRHLLQHGRASSQQVTFLVISDGRGNVPRVASLKNALLDGIITREGIEDALSEAVQVSSIHRVETIVLNPQPLHYPELPGLLARVLGAEMLDIPQVDDETEVVQ
jgi:magnesium chelatase subunit D